jgi:hypothetical protein
MACRVPISATGGPGAVRTPSEWTHCRDFMGGEYDTRARKEALIAEVQQDAQKDLRYALQALYTAALQCDSMPYSEALTLAAEVLTAYPANPPATNPIVLPAGTGWPGNPPPGGCDQ